MKNSFDTIISLATAPVSGALAVIRLSGPDAFTITKKVIDKELPESGYTITYAKIIDNNKIIDEVLINKFNKPHSFTGEDVIEINCHGSLYVAKKIIELLIKEGCRQSLPGEFSKRAFLNNKLSLNQVNAINNLVKSTNDISHFQAINGLNNDIFPKIENHAQELFKIVGQLEVNIDYPEYDDVPEIKKETIIKTIRKINNDLNQLAINSSKIIQATKSIKVAIVGEPNVGKSSLLNYLIGSEKAIVTDVAGTTRDIIEQEVNLGKYSIKLLDTAGIRTTKDKVEKIGVEKSHQAIKNADLILFLMDGSKPTSIESEVILNEIKNKPHLIVLTKSDLGLNNKTPNAIAISIKKHDISNLIKAIEKKIGYDIDFSNYDFLQTEHDLNILKQINNNLEKAITMLENEQDLDIVNDFVREALEKMNLLLGKDFDFINEIFKNFCVGK